MISLATRVLCLALVSSLGAGLSADDSWPPQLRGAKDGVATLRTEAFLKKPQSLEAASEGAAPFVMAKTPPTVELAYHGDLGPDAVNRRLWSSWGDICVAADGSVYSGVGDHHDAVGGDARAFLYRWNPKKSLLEQVADLNRVAPRKPGQPAWSKVHARIDEDAEGNIYVSGTLNDGNRARQEEYKWSEELPGGQIYRYDPSTGKTEIFADLPPKRCTATSILDRQRGVWWCNLEAGEGNAIWGLDLKTKKAVCQTPDGSVAFNRNFALLADGSILFNGENGLVHLDPETCDTTAKKATFPESPGMRASTRQSRDGFIYGTTYRTNHLFRYEPAEETVKMLGPTWLAGEYTTVTVLSPDERYVYYLPGSHGKAHRYGTPVVQYEIATGTRKVLAFLAEAFEKECGYVPGGSYGVKLSPDGGTLYVNFNGHAADGLRPESMKPIGFGLCAFAAIHIPESERE